jgi:hypothetical protein
MVCPLFHTSAFENLAPLFLKKTCQDFFDPGGGYIVKVSNSKKSFCRFKHLIQNLGCCTQKKAQVNLGRWPNINFKLRFSRSINNPFICFFSASSILFFSFNRHWHRKTIESVSVQWPLDVGQLSLFHCLVHLCLTMTNNWPFASIAPFFFILGRSNRMTTDIGSLTPGLNGSGLGLGLKELGKTWGPLALFWSVLTF